MESFHEENEEGLKSVLGLKLHSSATSVPDSDQAKLMYYLKCISALIDIDDAFSDPYFFRRFMDYHRHPLDTHDEEIELCQACMKFSPTRLKNHCIFHEEDMCGEFTNMFYDCNMAENGFNVSGNVVVAGRLRKVKQIMCYSRNWIEMYWSAPLKRLIDHLEAKSVSSTWHPDVDTLPSSDHGYNSKEGYKDRQEYGGREDFSKREIQEEDYERRRKDDYLQFRRFSRVK